MICNQIWLVGTGLMAIEYAKVLKSLNVTFKVIGRRDEGCDNFEYQTGIRPIKGGLDKYLSTKPEKPLAVINATGIESLSLSTQQLLNYGVKYMLLEKPGFGNPDELKITQSIAEEKGVIILLGYNRRFYSSVYAADEIIMRDGGVKSFNFEFTEWSHSIMNLKKDKVELENWFYGNSSHLIDLAFYLGGYPLEMNCFKKGSLPWHPAGCVYSGSGLTKTGALFSYIANWSSPGRWGLEICTNNFRLIFKPIEKLKIMKLGSVQIEDIDDIDYNLDDLYKPGLYRQVNAFLNRDYSRFLNFSDQVNALNNIYLKING